MIHRHIRVLWALAVLCAMPYAHAATHEEFVSSYSGNKVVDPAEVVLFLERRGCHGFCLPYRVTIFGTGVIEYDDLQGDEGNGIQRGKIPEAAVLNLVNQFMYERFFDAEKEYLTTAELYVRKGRWYLRSVGVADIPDLRLGMRIGSAENSVLLEVGYPKSLNALAEEVDRIVNTEKWLRAHPLCSLEGYGTLSVCSGKDARSR